MLKPIKDTELVNHVWKPCTFCNGEGSYPEGLELEYDKDCYWCGGTGKEPVEMENPVLMYEEDGLTPVYKHQVGVAFEVEKKEECDCFTESESCFECGGEGTIITCWDDLCRNGEHCIHGDGEDNCSNCNGEGEVNLPCSEHNKTLKFLPIRQKTEGDNSVLMVVKG